MTRAAWLPGDIAATNVGRFLAREKIGTFAELRTRSIDEPEWFWDAVVRFLGLPFATPYESVLDTSHLREYTDLASVQALVAASGLRIVALERRLLWFPLLDPLLFRIGGGLRSRPTARRALRAAKVPIPGYYNLELALER